MSSFWPQLGGVAGQTPQHGGVPQAGNLSLHLELLTAAVRRGSASAGPGVGRASDIRF
jgi:hypothetical protein